MSDIKKEIHSLNNYLLRRVKNNVSQFDEEKNSTSLNEASKEDLRKIREFVNEKMKSKYGPIIRDYMCIPENCLLRTHMLHDHEELMKMTSEDIQKLQEEIDEMHVQIKRVRGSICF